MSFGAEKEILKPVPVPKEVTAEIVVSVNSDVPLELEASSVNLDNDGVSELLVTGDLGANTAHFWIFRAVNQKWKMIFSARAHTLEIGKTATNGYFDITILVPTRSDLQGATFSYNLSTYAAKECFESTSHQGKPKTVYYKCQM